MSALALAACPEEEELVELASGLLASDPARSSALHAHVDACDPCGLLLADLLRAAASETGAGGGLLEALRLGASVRPGERIGRYLLLDELGRGGMGVVCAAFDPQLDRRVALKRVRPGSAEPRKACARLLAEAQALARLSHPNVITVYDAQLLAGGELFVAMELLPGRTLRDLLQEHAEAGGRQALRSLLQRFLEAGEGLCAAHAAGLVHGDFKPENALLGEDGRVRVADFGLAREAGEGAQGQVAGTPAYLAPEQWFGRPADARSDQFAFCVALWEALAGARPFAGLLRGPLLEQIASGPLAQDAARIPPRLRRLLLRGLSFEPQDRHPSLRALLGALAPLADLAAPRRGAVMALAAGATGAVAGTALLAAFVWSGGLSGQRQARGARTALRDGSQAAAHEATAAERPAAAPLVEQPAPAGLPEEDAPQAEATTSEQAVSPSGRAAVPGRTTSAPVAAPPPAPAPAALGQHRPPAKAPVARPPPSPSLAEGDEESMLASQAAGLASHGDPQGALALHRRLLSLREQRHGTHALSAAHARLDLGLDLVALGDVEEGRAEVRAALAALSRGFFSREPEAFASELRALDAPAVHPAAPAPKATPARTGALPVGAPAFAPEDELAPGARTVR